MEEEKEAMGLPLASLTICRTVVLVVEEAKLVLQDERLWLQGREEELCNSPLAVLLEATGQMVWVGTEGVLVWVGKNSLEGATAVALISHQLLGNLE